MKTRTIYALLAAWLWLAANAGAALPTVYPFDNLGLRIPDNDASGMFNQQVISGPLIGEVRVHLEIIDAGSGAPACNGDFYVYLQHGPAVAVLLNRPGRTLDNPAGYGDAGLSVTFADSGANGDIHQYRATLFSGVTDLPLNMPLTDSISLGGWAPDGRNVDPSVVTDTTERTAPLSVFNSMPASGSWTLFVADRKNSGVGVLKSWSLEITAVPEPIHAAWGVGVCFIYGGWRLVRTRSNRK
jgi:subtilisin-like proprotein convertase family protein